MLRLNPGNEYYLVVRDKKMHAREWEIGIFAKVVLKKITPQKQARVDIVDLYYENPEVISADIVPALGFRPKGIFEDISSIPSELKHLIINGVFKK